MSRPGSGAWACQVPRAARGRALPRAARGLALPRAERGLALPRAVRGRALLRAVRGRALPHPVRRRGFDRGSATAELAMGLPAVLLLLLIGLTAVGAVTTKLQCVDAAREAVLAASRGEPGEPAGLRAAPAGAGVSVSLDGDTVVATVRAPVPLLGARLRPLSVDASAVAAREPGSLTDWP